MRRKTKLRIGALLKTVCICIGLLMITSCLIDLGQSIWSGRQESSGEKQTTAKVGVINEKAGIPKELCELLERNPDAEEFVSGYLEKKDLVYEIDLTGHLNSETLPLFMQWDERWGYTIYGSNVMGLTGCGPTCLSMVLVHLLQDATYTPRYVADFAEENGYYVEGSGSKWALIFEGGETLGLDVTELPLDENRMKKNLEQGNQIICIMGPGDFTTAGHYIVLRGIEDGKFVVNDPNSKTNSERLWSYEEIQGQIKNLWACRRPE